MAPFMEGLSPRAVHAPWEAKLADLDYPPPVVDHERAREETLRRYAAVKKNGAAKGAAGT